MVPEIIGNDHETNGIVTNLPYCCRKTGTVEADKGVLTLPVLRFLPSSFTTFSIHNQTPVLQYIMYYVFIDRVLN